MNLETHQIKIQAISEKLKERLIIQQEIIFLKAQIENIEAKKSRTIQQINGLIKPLNSS